MQTKNQRTFAHKVPLSLFLQLSTRHRNWLCNLLWERQRVSAAAVVVVVAAAAAAVVNTAAAAAAAAVVNTAAAAARDISSTDLGRLDAAIRVAERQKRFSANKALSV
jgi:hypothetical protein